MDTDGTEVWWDGWVEGFDRGMRLRPRTWEPILKNGASDAAMALDLLTGLCRLVGTSRANLADNVVVSVS